MSTHRFVTDGLEQCPFMPAFGAPTVMFERGSGWTPRLTVSDDEIEEAVTILSGVLAP
ncbi:hypothetical protein BH18ACT3_BH18ACT3_13260 [soil metagenome]